MQGALKMLGALTLKEVRFFRRLRTLRMRTLEAAVVARVKAMTRKEIILKAMQGELTWVAAAGIWASRCGT